MNKREIEKPIQTFQEAGREDSSALVGEAYQELRHIARAFRRRFPTRPCKRPISYMKHSSGWPKAVRKNM